MPACFPTKTPFHQINTTERTQNVFESGDYLPVFAENAGSNSANIDGTVNHKTYISTFASDIITIASHGLTTGDGPYWIASSGTLPAPLSIKINYWIIVVDGNTLKFAASLADATDDVPIDLTDDGTGTHTLLIPVVFKITPPNGEVWKITRMLVIIQDNAALTAEKYGGISTLDNGIMLKHIRNGNELILDVTNSYPPTGLAKWGSLCYDLSLNTFGAGDNFATARWTFADSGAAIDVDGCLNDTLEIQLNDDFSALTAHHFRFEGIKVLRP